jgi:L,D-peptidoglycan transpeptidase YkuD (ErfK/YbiS/YcfS/YnhG family)
VRKGTFLRKLIVAPLADNPQRGMVLAGGVFFPSALGRSGITRRKREGDGATPAGELRMVAVLYRADRLARPATGLPIHAIRPDDGWCDDPSDRAYNRQVRLPYPASHERLWRDDHLYDLVVVLDYNLARPVPGRGSAIFLHLAAPGFAPTAGCIAVTEPAMRCLLARTGPGTVLLIR